MVDHFKTDIDAISARENMILEKAAKLIRYIAMVPPVSPSTIPEIELLLLASANPNRTMCIDTTDLGTNIQPPIAMTLNAVIESNLKFRCAARQRVLRLLETLQQAATDIEFLSLPKSFHIHLIFVICSSFTVSLALFIRRHLSIFPVADGAQLMDVAAFHVPRVSPVGKVHDGLRKDRRGEQEERSRKMGLESLAEKRGALEKPPQASISTAETEYRREHY